MAAIKSDFSNPIKLVGAVTASVLIKVWLVAGELMPFNSDEAVIALMARHILHGARPIFFYGQAYMGSLDAFLVAAGFSLWGEQVWVIRLIQGLLYLGTLATTAWLGRVVAGSWQVGVLAAWLLAIPTVNITLYTTASLGGYGEALLLGNLILLVGLRIANPLSQWHTESVVKTNPHCKLLCLWAAWGFLAGLGLWVFGITLVYSLPIGLYLSVLLWAKYKQQSRGERRAGLVWSIQALALASAGAVLGSAPWWLYAFQYGFSNLISELGGGAIAGAASSPWLVQIGQHLAYLLLLGITVILGMRPPWSVQWLGLPLLPFVLFFWVAVWVYTLKSLKQIPFQENPRLVLVGVILTLLAGLVLTPFGADPSGRYFLPLAAPLALFAAEMILALRKRAGFWAWGLALLLLGYNLWGTVQCVLQTPPGITTQFDEITQVDHRDDPALIEFLRANGESRGYGNYWLAYPLAFHSEEELIFVPRLPYHGDFRYTERDNRYTPYDELVAQSDRVAYITTLHPELDNHLRQELDGLGVAWQEAQVGNYHVFYRLSRAVRPEEMGLGMTRH